MRQHRGTAPGTIVIDGDVHIRDLLVYIGCGLQGRSRVFAAERFKQDIFNFQGPLG